MAIATGSEDEIKNAHAFCNKLSRLKKPDTSVDQWANTQGHAWIPITETQISRMRGDGNCLFAAISPSSAPSFRRQDLVQTLDRKLERYG